jgi:hypothetical protein
MDRWNPGLHGRSGGVLANLDAGHLCRHDDDLDFSSAGERQIINHLWYAPLNPEFVLRSVIFFVRAFPRSVAAFDKLLNALILPGAILKK